MGDAAHSTFGTINCSPQPIGHCTNDGSKIGCVQHRHPRGIVGSSFAGCCDSSCPTALNHDSARTGSPRITVYTSTHFDCVPVPALLPPGTATPPAPPEGTTPNKEPVAGPGGVQPWPICKLQKKANKNRPSNYVWLQEAFEAICRNSAHTLGAKVEDGTDATPLFVVAGACPSGGMFGTPMQAMMYFHCSPASVRFWWVKPEAKKSSSFGAQFLQAHTKGPHKNLAGSSASKVYRPLATFFEKGECNGMKFVLELIDGCMRACIRMGEHELWLYLVWQEAWSSIMASTKFIKGNLVYQRDPTEQLFYFRSYSISGDSLTIGDVAHGPFAPGVVPSNVVQQEMR